MLLSLGIDQGNRYGNLLHPSCIFTNRNTHSHLILLQQALEYSIHTDLTVTSTYARWPTGEGAGVEVGGPDG